MPEGQEKDKKNRQSPRALPVLAGGNFPGHIPESTIKSMANDPLP